MIIFAGIDLETIAPVKIEDIRVSPIQISPVARQRYGFGQDYIRMTGASRTITITFALKEEDLDKRYKAVQDIVEWAKPYIENQLDLPMYADRHFDCVCTEYPSPSYRQWWESSLRLVFQTFDNPYWTSNEEIKANCGVPFTINGTAPPLMKIERDLTAKVANQTYSANGKSMVFDQIPAGHLLIDLNRQTAQVGNASIMQYFTKTSKFIEPVPGNITVSGNGTITYRERWI